MRAKISKIFIGMLLVGSLTTLYAQVTWSCSAATTGSVISEDHIYFLEDPTGIFTINDVINNGESPSFTLMPKNEIPRHLETVLWLKVYIENTHTESLDVVVGRVLGLDRSVEYFVYEDDIQQKYAKTGNAVPYISRPIIENNGLSFTIAPLKTAVVYVRIEGGQLFTGTLLLYRSDLFDQWVKQESNTYTVLLALFMGIVLINILVALVFKEIRILFYFIMMGAYALIFLLYGGQEYLFLPFIQGGWALYIETLYPLIGIVLLCYSSLYLKSKELYPLAHKVITGAGVLWVILFLCSLPSMELDLFYLRAGFGTLSLIGLIWLGTFHYKKDRDASLRYLLSILIFVVLEIYTIGIACNILEIHLSHTKIMLLLIILQSTLFSLSMMQSDIRDSILAVNKKYLLSKEKQIFLKNISHELRTPINGVVGAIELLQRTKKNPYQHELLDSADQAMQKIMSVVNDFVEVAISDGVFLKLKEESYDFILELNIALSSLEKLAIIKGLRFEKLLPGAMQNYLIGDSKRLIFLVTRLVSLSIKYTSHGFVKLMCEIDSDPESEQSVEIHFIVQDSGATPAGEFLSIAEKGEPKKDDSEIKMAENYLFVQLIELFGAKVWYNTLTFNDEVIGTEYHMVVEQKIGKRYGYKSEREQYMPLSAKGLSVLVAEDDLVNQKIIARLLENMNYSYHIVGNGSECVREWHKHRYDIILMDIQMPVMNGYEAALEIRLKEKMADEHKHIPIIAISAREDFYIFDECKRSGINSFLPKPFKIDQLKKEIEQFFTRIQSM